MEKSIQAEALLLYNQGLITNAPALIEYINAFRRYSSFKIWSINTGTGFPMGLNRVDFKIIILHYSIFGPKYQLNKKFRRYIGETSSYKVAFFQDEHHYCQQRFNFINGYNIDCVYTLLEPNYFKDVYLKYTNASKIVYALTGYVSDDLVRLADRTAISSESRTIDIGYRGRRLGYYMGRGAQEKYQIGMEFKKRVKNYNFILDIETEESKRIYGRYWYRFLSNCRFVLGVETGVSIFDLKGYVQEECGKILSRNPKITFEELSKIILYKWEDNIYYRTIGPRHFEAAAFRVCQVLFEGEYSGILKPMVHYIPLKKDFSNFNEVMVMLKDKKLYLELTNNAYHDLVVSGLYSYRKFIRDFDQELIKEGFTPGDIGQSQIRNVTSIIQKGQYLRNIYGRVKAVKSKFLPGKNAIISYVKSIIEGED